MFVLAGVKKEKDGVAKAKERAVDEKVKITPELTRLWITIRQAWGRNLASFSSVMAGLDDKQAEMLYGVVRLSLYKNSYVEIIMAHPELRPFLKSDDDRFCMHDMYQRLSWRLNKREELPPGFKLAQSTKARIGRDMPDYKV
ncbi:MAG: hypothetical protein V1827_01105 [Candidatus Micrarchaeota archaeon]